MSKNKYEQRRQTERAESPPNPEPVESGPMRRGFIYHRGEVGWRLIELEMPESVAMRYATKQHPDDILGMVSARASLAIEREAQR